MITSIKVCTKCGIGKPLSEFRIKIGKYVAQCKQCEKDYWNNRKEKTAEYSKEWRAKNLSKIKQKAKNYRVNKRIEKFQNSDFDLSILSDFVDIPNYKGLYKINKKGDVIGCPNINNYFFRFKKPEMSKGYNRVTLFKDGIGKHFFIHQLVAITFIPNPQNKPHINHINGIKTDNRLENLEWCTPKENVHHSIENNLAGTNRCRKHKTNKSGYIGVYFHKGAGKFVARLTMKDGRRKTLGYFDNAIDGAKSYDKALLKEWGKRYDFNFPEEILT